VWSLCFAEQIPHFPQYKKKSVCPSLLEQADFFLYGKDAVGRLLAARGVGERNVVEFCCLSC
jgi:hypothetical protein